VAIFKDYIKHAKFLDAKMIASETSYSIITEENRDRAMAYVVEALREIMLVAEKEGVLVAFEPVVYHALNTPKLTRELLDTINSSHLKILYDQANLLSPEAASEDEAILEQAKEYFGRDVIALHLKNFVVKEGEKISAPLGSGVVNIPAILQWVSQEGLEVEIIREESTKEELSDDLTFIQENMIIKS
jgi:sugar phosphate isomerase/epimerase